LAPLPVAGLPRRPVNEVRPAPEPVEGSSAPLAPRADSDTDSEENRPVDWPAGWWLEAARGTLTLVLPSETPGPAMRLNPNPVPTMTQTATSAPTMIASAPLRPIARKPTLACSFTPKGYIGGRRTTLEEVAKSRESG